MTRRSRWRRPSCAPEASGASAPSMPPPPPGPSRTWRLSLRLSSALNPPRLRRHGPAAWAVRLRPERSRSDPVYFLLVGQTQLSETASRPEAASVPFHCKSGDSAGEFPRSSGAGAGVPLHRSQRRRVGALMAATHMLRWVTYGTPFVRRNRIFPRGKGLLLHMLFFLVISKEIWVEFVFSESCEIMSRNWHASI
jgi:hypothetical protein